MDNSQNCNNALTTIILQTRNPHLILSKNSVTINSINDIIIKRNKLTKNDNDSESYYSESSEEEEIKNDTCPTIIQDVEEKHVIDIEMISYKKFNVLAWGAFDNQRIVGKYELLKIKTIVIFTFTWVVDEIVVDNTAPLYLSTLPTNFIPKKLKNFLW